jgi:putative nucleotidyltransferase with HDIG domain
MIPTTETSRIATSIDSLPTLPIVALRIGEVVHGKNVSVPQVAEVLRSDPAISAKLLRLVNSPYFGIPGGVSDVARAIPFVGFNTLYQLVLSISVLDALKGASDVRALWIHSLVVGIAARELATELGFNDPGTCFTAGLLHDMGNIALAKVEADKVGKVMASVRDEGLTIKDAELKHDMVAHERIGCRLARQWKFPAQLVTPIEQHHTVHRLDVRERMTPSLRSITEIVSAADHLASSCATPFTGAISCNDGDDEAEQLFDRNGFTTARRDALVDRAKTQLERSQVFLSLIE